MRIHSSAKGVQIRWISSISSGASPESPIAHQHQKPNQNPASNTLTTSLPRSRTHVWWDFPTTQSMGPIRIRKFPWEQSQVLDHLGCGTGWVQDSLCGKQWQQQLLGPAAECGARTSSCRSNVGVGSLRGAMCGWFIIRARGGCWPWEGEGRSWRDPWALLRYGLCLALFLPFMPIWRDFCSFLFSLTQLWKRGRWHSWRWAWVNYLGRDGWRGSLWFDMGIRVQDAISCCINFSLNLKRLWMGGWEWVLFEVGRKHAS